MKCIYYLSPTLASTEVICDDLHDAGVDDWFMHIISRDEDGLSRRRLHSSNYLETLDFVRDGLYGAGLGFVAGLGLAWLGSMLQPFGSSPPWIAYLAVVFLTTCFGAWVGGLIGLRSENRKIRRFHDDVEAGSYLILVYARRHQEQQVQDMMDRLHPEARLVGVDPKFYNPFSEPVPVTRAYR